MTLIYVGKEHKDLPKKKDTLYAKSYKSEDVKGYMCVSITTPDGHKTPPYCMTYDTYTHLFVNGFEANAFPWDSINCCPIYDNDSSNFMLPKN